MSLAHRLRWNSNQCKKADLHETVAHQIVLCGLKEIISLFKSGTLD